MLINIENALKIQGWMSNVDLQWLAEQASSHVSIVEIGCWKGRSTRALADNTNGIVYAIDTWKGSAEHVKMFGEGIENWLFAEFLQNMRWLNNVRISQKYSIEAAQDFHDMKFDMIFIDASHDYENVKKDILVWYPLLEEGGLFCGHDSKHPHIVMALKELLPEYKNVSDGIWMTIKKGDNIATVELG